MLHQVASLIGILVQKGLLNVDDTLETALPRVQWESVTTPSEKKAITIAELLSMSSGLHAPCLDYGQQGTVEEVLSSPGFDASGVGRFSYPQTPQPTTALKAGEYIIGYLVTKPKQYLHNHCLRFCFASRL